MKNHKDTQLLKPNEAGNILGVTSRSVIRYCNQGLPHYKIGNSIRLDIRDVLNYRRKIENRK